MTEEADPSTLSYEQLIESLERTLERMAAGQVGLEETVDLYEQAGRLHDLAAERLAHIQERIDRLTDGT